MIIDFITLNGCHILLSSILLKIFYLDDNKVYGLLIIDILFNGIPFVTILIVLLYYFNKKIFLIFNDTLLIKYLLIIMDYFIFNITLYSIFNSLDRYIFIYLMDNLSYNLIFYYIGLNYLDYKYNIEMKYE